MSDDELYDYGDDEHHHDSSSSDDDDKLNFVSSKRRRFQYTTFGDDDEDEDAERDDIDINDNGKDAATYGVFLEDEGGSSRKRFKSSSKFSTTPMFVKSTIEEKQNDNDDKQQQDDASSTTQQEHESKDDKQKSVEQKEDDNDDLEAVRLEEQKRQEQQKAANARFYELLGRGRGARRQRDSQDEQKPYDDDEQGPPAGAGLGFSVASMESAAAAVAPGLGMPSSFGGGIGMQKQKPPSPVRVDPNLGKWEKHTKGIGMKLLTKMGYKGSGGLGAKRLKTVKETGQLKEEKRVGISRPVEVKVRPSNLGLGFGTFKEATALKVNKQIEAEVRGVELPKKEDDEKDKLDLRLAGSSALPTTQELLQQQSWKRGAKQQASRKRPRRTVVLYTELLETQKQPVIIDMRGPAAAQEADEGPKEVPLAEELLHNVTILLNTYENKIHSASHFVQSTARKLESLRSDVKDMDRRKRDVDDRIVKLENVLQIIDEIESLLGEDGGAANIDAAVDKAQTLVHQLGESFSPEERVALRFDDVLAPSLLSPLVSVILNAWDPLRDDAATTETLITSTLRFAVGNDKGSQSLRRSIFTDHIVARVKQSLASTKWDPVTEVENAVRLVDAVIEATEEAFPNEKQETSEEVMGSVLLSESMEEQNANVVDNVKREIVLETVVPKLSRALSQWEPILNEDDTMVEDRLDLWILPWIHHLDHPAVLPQLLTDCRRKLRSALSYLQRKVTDDDQYFHMAISMLRPWNGIIQSKILRDLTSKYITTRMARFLSRQPVSRIVKQQDWSGLGIVFWTHETGIMSDREFLSLVEGSILSVWLENVYDWLSSLSEIDTQAFAGFYTAWKTKLFLHSDGDDGVAPSSVLLKGDATICRMLYSGLFLLQAAQSSGTLENYVPSTSSFQVVLARRSKEDHTRVEEELRRMEFATTNGAGSHVRRPPISRRDGDTTFRDVVEDFANEQGVPFVPKMGANSTMDGKQVFLFGKTHIYLDANVVYALQDSKWRPISLDQLATIA